MSDAISEWLERTRTMNGDVRKMGKYGCNGNLLPTMLTRMEGTDITPGLLSKNPDHHRHLSSFYYPQSHLLHLHRLQVLLCQCLTPLLLQATALP